VIDVRYRRNQPMRTGFFRRSILDAEICNPSVNVLSTLLPIARIAVVDRIHAK